MKTFKEYITEEATLSKEEAGYVEIAPGKEHCGNCSMFKNPHSCTLVKGIINSEGRCKHWGAK